MYVSLQAIQQPLLFTYEEQLGNVERKHLGNNKWTKRSQAETRSERSSCGSSVEAYFSLRQIPGFQFLLKCDERERERSWKERERRRKRKRQKSRESESQREWNKRKKSGKEKFYTKNFRRSSTHSPFSSYSDRHIYGHAVSGIRIRWQILANQSGMRSLVKVTAYETPFLSQLKNVDTLPCHEGVLSCNSFVIEMEKILWIWRFVFPSKVSRYNTEDYLRP